MSISATTSTLLWGRARSLCSKCRRDLAPLIKGQAGLAGFQCHITAANSGGARYDANLTPKQRDDYTNLILLCGSCHAEIDKFAEHFTVGLLHAIKAGHEDYVAQRLTIDDEIRAIRGEILANAVDLIVEGLHLERWDEWTSEILGPSPYLWPHWALGEYHITLRPATEAVLLPDDAASLEISAKMVVDAAIALHFTFCRHSSYEKLDFGVLVCRSIEAMLSEYRGPSDYDINRDLMHWDETLELGLVHLAKCVNWFADAVRERVSPCFRIRPGAFIVEPSKFERSNGVYRFTRTEIGHLVERGYSQPRNREPWELAAASWLEAPRPDYGPSNDPATHKATSPTIES